MMASSAVVYAAMVPVELRGMFPYDQFAKGMIEEREHDDITGGNQRTIALIVLAHLKENPRYYDYLEAASARYKQGLAPNRRRRPWC
jgi:hypothetical protein